MYVCVYAYICILFICVKSKVREVGAGAPWRSNALSHCDVILHIMRRRGHICPLLEAPWVTTSIFKMDWLHAADQGITADFIGNIFYWAADKYPGDTKDARANALMGDIQCYYEDDHVDDRLDCLKPGFYESRQGMKLRCSAAKCRKLVPFVAKMTNELCNLEDPVEDAMQKAAFHLNAVYDALSSSAHNAPATLKDHSIKFALLYVALHDHFGHLDDRLFRLKPKLHFFMHLCSDGGSPALHWCYRDEDFGGSVAKAARRRGGLMKASATSYRVLTCMQVNLPRLSIR